MATRKGSRSSSSGGGEPKNTGLVVSLVIFVILTIALGVTTYLGYAGQTDLRSQANQDKQKAGESDKRAQKEETLKLAYKIAAGVSTEGDRTTFSGRKSTFAQDITTEVAAMKALGTWDVNSPANQPPKTYQQLLEEAVKARQTAEAAQRARENDLAEARKQFEADKQDLTRRIQATEKKLADANTEIQTVRNNVHGGADQASKKIKELTDQVAQLTLEKQSMDVEKSREINKQSEQIATMKQVREEFASRIGPLMDKLAQVSEARPELRDLVELRELLSKQFDTAQQITNDPPKGQVARVDRDRELVYVNLGSADYVRPQLTFSVMPAGSTGKNAAARPRKGAVEIVTVLEAHLSTAKIVEEVSRFRDPIMPGDLLFNPAWSPTQREHVAIAGIIDLNGDGLDDTQDLIRQLEKQGVAVDAYLDLKDKQIKGTGITEKTTYLIIGERPTLPQSLLAAENNALAQAARDVLGKMTEMETKAREMGVQRVPYRRFLSLIGFKLPKGTSDLGASSYLRGTGSIKPTEPESERPR